VLYLRLSGLIVDVFGDLAVIASSAAWVEKYKQEIEGSISRIDEINHINWRPSVEILKEEGINLSDLKEMYPSACPGRTKVGNPLKHYIFLISNCSPLQAPQSMAIKKKLIKAEIESPWYTPHPAFPPNHTPSRVTKEVLDCFLEDISMMIIFHDVHNNVHRTPKDETLASTFSPESHPSCFYQLLRLQPVTY
jgi:hypothetical protein